MSRDELECDGARLFGERALLLRAQLELLAVRRRLVREVASGHQHAARRGDAGRRAWSRDRLSCRSSSAISARDAEIWARASASAASFDASSTCAKDLNR